MAKPKRESMRERQRRLLRQQRERRDARNKDSNTKRLPSKGGTGANSRQATGQRRTTRTRQAANQQRIMSEGTRQYIS